MKNKLLAAVALSTAFVLSAACGAGEKVVIKFAHSVSSDSHYQVGAEEFKRLVEEKSGGAMEVQIYPSGQLGAEREVFEGMKLGSIEMCIGITSVFSQSFNNKDCGVFLLPWVWPGDEQMYRLIDGDIFKKVFADSRKHGIEVITAYDNGFRHLTNSARPVDKVADVKGMKVRTPEAALYIRAWTLLGASPSPLAWTEVYNALQTGVMDAQEAPLTVFYTDRIFETQKYVAMINYINDPLLICAAAGFMESLTEAQRTIIRESALESARVERKYYQTFVRDAIAELESKYGIQFTYPDTAEFKAVLQPMYDDFENQKLLAEVQEFLAK